MIPSGSTFALPVGLHSSSGVEGVTLPLQQQNVPENVDTRVRFGLEASIVHSFAAN